MAVFKANDLYAGRYLLERLVGEGGFSEVWKAKDTMANEAVVALKIYAPEKGLEEFGIKQFRKEYFITHHLSHPHLMKVFHFDIDDRSPYLIMPYYRLGSLSNLLFEQGTLNETQIALFMYQVGGALEELHKQEPVILHQDIKPDNILIQQEDHFILTDFGISSQTRHTLSKSTGSFKSLTIAYAPPERFDKNPASNEASDIFSFGVTLYETCTGQVPWEGNGGQSLLQGAQVPELPTRFPRELNRMIQACMSLDSSERPTAGRIKKWGKFYLDNAYWKFEDDKNKKPLPLMKFILVGVAALLIIALSGFFYYKNSQKPLAATAEKDSTTVVTPAAPVVAQDTLTEVPADSAVQQTTEVPPSPQDESTPEMTGTGQTATQQAAPRSAPKQQVSNVQPAVVAENNYQNPKDIQEYLNEISNPNVPRKVRKEWKKEALALFENSNVLVLDKSETLSKKYHAGELLDLLMDIPHKVKVDEALFNTVEKITELHIKMTSR